ncbi:aminotransferase class IV [Perlabentimonas gracilis]|uniref:aminotransferase class IV n=1 Tax=Perlabentimonas gracilis TaxID=2715279 RepID=UPI00140C2A26|nr:aminotransferase class IV [Perlabentimonas gracilis]NHB69570.1 4-amino-4-deoxychorismate lyase [Perlabentimonas gracilis]
MDRQYVWHNGDFSRINEPVVAAGNRSFLYGDGFFETIHAFGTEAKYLQHHLARIIKSAELLSMELPPFFKDDFLGKEITRLLNKNRIFDSARVRLTIFREQGGLYTPTRSTVGMLMFAETLQSNYYPLNSKGLVVDLYTDIRKPINILSPLKSCNAQLYVMAGLHKQRLGVDDCLLINDQNRVVEAISSNLFLVKGDKIITPSLGEGCVAGVMRQVVIDLAIRNGYKLNTNAAIEPEMLLNADELFLTNAVSGIKWIVGLRQKRYFGLVSRKLSDLLNEETFGV